MTRSIEATFLILVGILPVVSSHLSVSFEDEKETGPVNVDNILEVGQELDDWTIPVYWHVPKAGGSSVLTMTGFCLDILVACEVGIREGHDQDTKLDVMSLDDTPDHFFLNVDTTTEDGLQRAQDMGFAEAEVAELVFTGLLPLASNTIVDNAHLGSVFTTFRHPIERVVSLFYYLQEADWEPTYHPEWKDMSLLDYAKSGEVESNYMVRALTGKYEGSITKSDLDMAMKFVSERVWVGLLDQMDESMRRFGALYGWNDQENWEDCLDDAVNIHANEHPHPPIEKGTPEYEKLEELLRFDIALYKHAASVFNEQGKFFRYDEDER